MYEADKVAVRTDRLRESISMMLNSKNERKLVFNLCTKMSI